MSAKTRHDSEGGKSLGPPFIFVTLLCKIQADSSVLYLMMGYTIQLIHIVLAAVLIGPLFLARLLGQRYRVVKCVVILGLACTALFLMERPGDRDGTDAGEQSVEMPKTARERMLVMSRNRGIGHGGEGRLQHRKNRRPGTQPLDSR